MQRFRPDLHPIISSIFCRCEGKAGLLHLFAVRLCDKNLDKDSFFFLNFIIIVIILIFAEKLLNEKK